MPGESMSSNGIRVVEKSVSDLGPACIEKFYRNEYRSLCLIVAVSAMFLAVQVRHCTISGLLPDYYLL
jgi:hypothetical protein